ncbi:MAG: Holliday junction resolvase RuvX [Candidatus Marinimicrobia bacterium]|nr:Holliday junction resolvase RuvX [Candidatus Neomarinimicrobiota bacterium]|tara:strand:- start:2450 stop:2869 length:420 start_codon:yes stop_codon:yes gene_type:complete
MLNSRLMAIDYGERKVGIAISDPLHIIASPYKTIDRRETPDYISEIRNIIEEKNIFKIIVGYPLTMLGKESQQTKLVVDFVNLLKKEFDIKILKYDERLSSKQAERYIREQNIKVGKNKEKVDQISASIILEQYMSISK